MNKYIEQVKEFHESFNHPVGETIVDDNLELRKLRLSLIFEEMVELSEAMGCVEHLETLCDKFFDNKIYSDTYDKVKTLDAFADIQYVLSGGVISLGYYKSFDKAFDEVHRSNMSKMCDENQVNETIEYHIGRGETQEMVPVSKNDKYIIVRSDGKIMKSKYYSPADLSKYILDNLQS